MALRAQIIVKGIVQGVGFRPFVYSLARSLELKGYVTNTSEGVLIEIEGENVPAFIERLRNQAPPLSRITETSVINLPLHGYSDFTIRQSSDGGADRPFTLVSPDVSTCDDCLREMLDPNDRRYLYPFINCTNCGPRYSITRSVPYDRPNTTMVDFTMCPECSREYSDPLDRRFHAQPNACSTCGPRVEFRARGSEFGVHGEEAMRKTIRLLACGGIVAVKGIGGFHIACDAMNDDAVRRLRVRKRRSNKPFAVMAPDMRGVERFCHVSKFERETLLSNRRPIVLLHKRDDCSMPEAVSPNNKSIGFMLPYTPLHHLLFHCPDGSREPVNDPHFKALVMTSGNLSEEPIVRDNEEAIVKLSDIVDGFLLHNRDIFMRVDDSVVRVRSWELGVGRGLKPELRTHHSELLLIRRSRGYAPDPIELHDEGPEVLACGADLKNTFTLTKGKFAIPSQHIGDMENYETVRLFEESLANLKAVYRAEPVAIVHDLHPGYLSTQWALNYSDPRTPNSELRRFGIQHHFAHIGSVMAEHGLTSKVIGVVFDGTGYGTDGNLWGGEFLIADIDGFERAGQFKYIPLPGGESAIREPWRVAVSYLVDAGGERAWSLLEEAGFVGRYGKGDLENIIKIVHSRGLSPLSSGAGRLFDAVSALIGVCDRNAFEGEAAIALESFVVEDIDDQYVVELKQEKDYTIIDHSPTIHGILRDMSRGVPKDVIATKFHNTVAKTIHVVARRIRERTGITDVALSGGTFQNQYLMKRADALLSANGFKVYINSAVPCNDAGISLGQAYLVRERLKKFGVRRWESGVQDETHA
jgi:hydrogenase maturation protein HypF